MLPETLTVGQVLLCGAAVMLAIVLRIALAATGLWPAWRAGARTERGWGVDLECGDGGDGGGD